MQLISKGTKESKHYHKVATEVTVLITGKAIMFGQEIVAGQVVFVSPGEATSFEALEDCVTAVVKVPGATGDKYLVEAFQ